MRRFKTITVQYGAACALVVAMVACGKQTAQIRAGQPADQTESQRNSSQSGHSDAVLSPGPLRFVTEPSTYSAQGLIASCTSPNGDRTLVRAAQGYQMPDGLTGCKLMAIAGLKGPEIEIALTDFAPDSPAESSNGSAPKSKSSREPRKWSIAESVSAENKRSVWIVTVMVDIAGATRDTPVRLSISREDHPSTSGEKYSSFPEDSPFRLKKRSAQGSPDIEWTMDPAASKPGLPVFNFRSIPEADGTPPANLKFALLRLDDQGRCDLDAAGQLVTVDSQVLDLAKLAAASGPAAGYPVCGIKAVSLTGSAAWRFKPEIINLADAAMTQRIRSLLSQARPPLNDAASSGTSEAGQDRQEKAPDAPQILRIPALSLPALSLSVLASSGTSLTQCFNPHVMMPAASLDSFVNFQGCLTGVSVPGMAYDFGFASVALIASDYIPAQVAYFGASKATLSLTHNSASIPMLMAAVGDGAAVQFNAIYPTHAEVFTRDQKSGNFFSRRQRDPVNPETLTLLANGDSMTLDLGSVMVRYDQIPGQGFFRIKSAELLNPYASGCTKRTASERITFNYATASGDTLSLPISIVSSRAMDLFSGSSPWNDWQAVTFTAADGRITQAEMRYMGIAKRLVSFAYNRSGTLSTIAHKLGNSVARTLLGWTPPPGTAASAPADALWALTSVTALRGAATTGETVSFDRDESGRVTARNVSGVRDKLRNGLQMAYSYKPGKDLAMVGMADRFNIKSVMSVTNSGSDLIRLVNVTTTNDFAVRLDDSGTAGRAIEKITRYFDRSNDVESTSQEGRISKVALDESGRVVQTIMNDVPVASYSYGNNTMQIAYAGDAFTYRVEFHPTGIAKSTITASGFGSESTCVAEEALERSIHCAWEVPAGSTPLKTCMTVSDPMGSIQQHEDQRTNLKTVYKFNQDPGSGNTTTSETVTLIASTVLPTLSSTTTTISQSSRATSTRDSSGESTEITAFDPESGVVTQRNSNFKSRTGSSSSYVTTFDYSTTPPKESTTANFTPAPGEGEDLWVTQ